MESVTLQALPAPLTWMHDPQDWESSGVDALSITASAKTDLFIDPQSSQIIDNSPRLLFSPQDGAFLFLAKVSVDFHDAFDAGVLLLYANDREWAKLCFEYAPDGSPMIVSVVTQTVSDDCNSQPIDGNTIYLRIARLGQAYAFHFSKDGRYWHLVRLFRLGAMASVRVGFSSQSPTGHGCTAHFSNITFERRPLTALRHGE